MLAAVAVKTSQCYLGLGDYSYPKLVYSSSDCQPSPSYSYRPHPSTDGRLSPEPSQADLGLFSHSISPKKIALARKTNTKQRPSAGCSCFVCPSLDMTQQTAAKLNESAPSVTMSCFLLTADSAWKSRKRKQLHQQIPEILKFPNRQTSCLPRATLPNDCRNLGSLV